MGEERDRSTHDRASLLILGRYARFYGVLGVVSVAGAVGTSEDALVEVFVGAGVGAVVGAVGEDVW